MDLAGKSNVNSVAMTVSAMFYMAEAYTKSGKRLFYVKIQFKRTWKLMPGKSKKTIQGIDAADRGELVGDDQVMYEMDALIEQKAIHKRENSLD